MDRTTNIIIDVVLLVWVIAAAVWGYFYLRSRNRNLTNQQRRKALITAAIVTPIAGIPICSPFAIPLFVAIQEESTGWLLFTLYTMFSTMGWCVERFSRHELLIPPNQNFFQYIAYGLYGLGGAAAFGLIFAGIGWVWYHLAGGFTVIEIADSLFEYIFYSFLSAFGLLFLIGAIIAAFKS